MGIKVDVYFDLGGIRILLSEEKYADTKRDVQAVKLPDTKLCVPHGARL